MTVRRLGAKLPVLGCSPSRKSAVETQLLIRCVRCEKEIKESLHALQVLPSALSIAPNNQQAG